MNTIIRLLLATLSCLLATLAARSATLYVWHDSPNCAPPYATWATAATNIQDAVDEAMAGDEIVVMNGVYQTGAREMYGMSNRVAVTKPVTVRSMNGPEVTVIAGYQAPGTTNGDEAVRCVYLTNGAVLAGFTLTNGATHASGSSTATVSGGGVAGQCCIMDCVVSNCVIVGNAGLSGGGAFSCKLIDCFVSRNTAEHGGGAAAGCSLSRCKLANNFAGQGGGASGVALKVRGAFMYYLLSTLDDCEIVENRADSGGGTFNSTLNNCILTGNSASQCGGGASGSTLNNCTLSGNQAYSGGVFRVEDIVVRGRVVGQRTIRQCELIDEANPQGGGGADNSRLFNCKLTGNSGACGGGASRSVLNNCTVVDNHACLGGGVFGGTLTNCIVYYNAGYAGNNGANFSDGTTLHYSCTTPLPTGGVGNITNEPAFVHQAYGDLRLRYGSPCIDAGTNLSAIITNDLDLQPRPLDGDGDGIAAFDMGAYECVPTVRYVWQQSFFPAPPYDTWLTAATSIQDAVDAAEPGDLVLVAGGVYDTGGRTAGGGLLTNRVVIDKPITVESLMGPEVTLIVGAPALGGTTNGDGAIRCVYLADGATLAGFTLTNGATLASGAWAWHQTTGGGVNCESTDALVTDCVLSGNIAVSGGGAFSGTLNDCTLAGNSADYGGGACRSTLANCALASNSADYSGGAAGSTLQNCVLDRNWARYCGGAVGPRYIRDDFGNSTLAEDSTLNACILTGNSASWGGGTYRGTLNNCTLTGNVATNYGGGAYGSALTNCTLTGNMAAQGGGASGSSLSQCSVSENTAEYGGGAMGAVFSTDGFGNRTLVALLAFDHCTFSSNSATYGGGVYFGTLNYCTLTGNVATNYGGGAYGSALTNCTLVGNSADIGGGVAASTVYSCILKGNSARQGGGGVGPIYSCDGLGIRLMQIEASEFYNCLIMDNSAVEEGGGVYGGSRICNCTLTGNTAAVGGAVAGQTNCAGGGIPCMLTNCIVYHNTAAASPNYHIATLSHSCTSPLPTNGVGNITKEPAFLDPAGGDFRLRSGSPCIDAGNNAFAFGLTDLAGRPRIIGGTVDMGSNEFQESFLAWLAGFGLRTDGAVDFDDADGDGLDNWREFQADTNPTNAASSLRLSIAATNSSVAVTFASSAARLYTLLNCTNLANATFDLMWTPVLGQQDVPGSGGSLFLMDTNPATSAFYRISVRFR